MLLLMKRILFTLVLYLFFAPMLHAQSQDVSLLLQSPDGKTVKLMWFFKKWDSNLTGFDIKRKDEGGSWQKLNKSAIMPEISRTRDLSVVEPDNAELQRIKNKLETFLSSKKLKEIDNKTYLQNLAKDEKAVQGVAVMIALDYDVALINGFAFVDRSIRKGGRYEYALFAEGTNKMLAQASWKYGDKPSLDIISDIRTKNTAKKNLLQLLWASDPEKIKSSSIAGFNVYRDGKKLNPAPVMAANNKQMTEFNWLDTVKIQEEHSYEVSAVTIFGIEGDRKAYQHNPDEHPAEHVAAEIGEITSEGDNFQNGIRVNWTFPKDAERFIKGFVIDKANLPAEFKKAGDINSATDKSYVDKTPSAVASYIKYRITVLYKDGTEVKSADKLYYYFPIAKPPKPKGLTAKWNKKGKEFTIDLSWNPAAAGDTLTSYYQLYASDPVTKKIYLESGIPPIRETHYSYPLQYSGASEYRFCVAAMSKYNIEGIPSDTVTVGAPSVELPYPAMKELSLDSNKVIVKWEYPDIWDVKGFRVYQNGNLVASEFEIKKGTKQFITPGLKWGASYNFSVQAVTEYGVESDMSIASGIAILPPSKK